MKIVSWTVFSVILPEPVENGFLDKLLFISSYPLYGMFIYLLYQLRTKKARLTRKIVGLYSWVFTVGLQTLLEYDRA